MTHDLSVDHLPRTLLGTIRLYEQAARLAKLGAWECDLATEELTWTDGVYDLFEVDPGSLLKRSTALGFYVDESRQTMEAMRADTIATGKSCTCDVEIRGARGAARWMRLSIDVAHDNGRPVRLFGAKQDVTPERQAWALLRQKAERDPLTGLANRAVFDERYRAMVADTSSYGGVSALVLIDLDHFKQINDRFGHLAGDECLREVAARLQRVFGQAKLVARIGGDEFAVLLHAALSQTRIRHVLSRAIDALNRRVLWNATPLNVGASIGATILGRPHMRKVSELFAEADAALYNAKAAGETRCGSSGTLRGRQRRSHKAEGRRVSRLWRDSPRSSGSRLSWSRARPWT